VLHAVFGALLHILARFHVSGVENLPAEGPTIIYLNHLSYIDSVAMFVVSPRRMQPLAAEKYEHHWFLGTLLRVAGAIFIQRGEVDRMAMKKATAVLEDGGMLALAIEGTRSKTGGLQPGKTGVAYFATRSDATLVPGVVWGTERLLPSLMRLRRADVYVKIGPAFKLPAGRARIDELEAYTDQMMVTLARMLPAQYRGVYRDHPGVTAPEAGALHAEVPSAD
jgi:1-acyl-sn-glycerol-3-phosphate acyltransferase